jgi:hypothetical protein
VAPFAYRLRGPAHAEGEGRERCDEAVFQKAVAEGAVRSGRGGGGVIWTTETPTKEGWYWFMELDGSDELIVNVYHTGGGVSGLMAASGENFNLVDLNGHRWAGPIERLRSRPSSGDTGFVGL